MRISDWSSDVCSSDLTSSARVRRLLEQPRQMRGVRRDHLRGLGHFLRRFLQILEVGRSHRLADPIAGGDRGDRPADVVERRSEEHTSELQSLMRTSYAVFSLIHKNK